MRSLDPLLELQKLLREQPSNKRTNAIDAWAVACAAHEQLSKHWLRSKSPQALLVILAETGERPTLVRAACACARAAAPMLASDNVAPLRAIEVAEAWARGEATAADVEDARRVIRVPELGESKAHRRNVYAPASARAAAWVATTIDRPNRVTAAGHAESAALNAAYALAGPATRHLAFAKLADIVRGVARCPTIEEIRR